MSADTYTLSCTRLRTQNSTLQERSNGVAVTNNDIPNKQETKHIRGVNRVQFSKLAPLPEI